MPLEMMKGIERARFEGFFFSARYREDFLHSSMVRVVSGYLSVVCMKGQIYGENSAKFILFLKIQVVFF